MKIFVAILLAFGFSLAEQNLTKELINKEMIKQITSPDEIKAREGYEKLCAEIVNDLKTGNDIEVLTPMSQKELWELKAKLEKKKSEPKELKVELNNWSRRIKEKDTTSKFTFYDLGDDSYLRDFEFSFEGGEKHYGITTTEEHSKKNHKNFHLILSYPHYTIRYNAMHKPIKYKDKYYVIRIWKSFDYKYFWNPSWETDTANKDKILFVMTLFDLHTRMTEACHVAKRINRDK